MVPLELFKVVPVQKHDNRLNLRQKATFQQEIAQQSQQAQRKIKKLVASLKDSGVIIDKSGFITSDSEVFEENVLPHLLYAVKGKDKPANWIDFASILATCRLPRNILATRPQSDVRRLRRNAKDQEEDSDY